MSREKPIDQYACAPTDDAEYSDVCGIGQDVKIQSKGNRTNQRKNKIQSAESMKWKFGRVKGLADGTMIEQHGAIFGRLMSITSNAD